MRAWARVRVREQMARPVTVGRVLAAVLMTCVVMGVVNIAVTAWMFRSLCGVIAAQSDVYREVPPSTPTGVAAAEAWGHARRTVCRV